MKVKSLLTIFAIATLLVSITGSYSGFSVYASSSDDSQLDDQSKTDREKIKEKIEEEKLKLKEFREEQKDIHEEKKKQFKDYKIDLREKYNVLKEEFREKYQQLRISTASDESDSENQNFQLEIKHEELKLLKQEFREHIKSLKLEAREHFDLAKIDMKITLEDRKNKMHDRIDALKEKYKEKMIEHYSSDSNVGEYTPEFSDKKVDVCHVPPGNSDNAHTISVSVNALRAHMGHGDYLAKCDNDSDEEEETEEEFELEVRADTLDDQSEVKVKLSFLTKTTSQDMIIEEIIENFALSYEEADAALKIEEEDDDNLKEKFRVEIDVEDDYTEVFVKLQFVLDSSNRDMIIEAIVEKTQLTAEQIEGILEEESDENETEEDGEDFKVKLEENLGIKQTD